MSRICRQHRSRLLLALMVCAIAGFGRAEPLHSKDAAATRAHSVSTLLALLETDSARRQRCVIGGEFLFRRTRTDSKETSSARGESHSLLRVVSTSEFEHRAVPAGFSLASLLRQDRPTEPVVWSIQKEGVVQRVRPDDRDPGSGTMIVETVFIEPYPPNDPIAAFEWNRRPEPVFRLGSASYSDIPALLRECRQGSVTPAEAVEWNGTQAPTLVLFAWIPPNSGTTSSKNASIVRAALSQRDGFWCIDRMESYQDGRDGLPSGIATGAAVRSVVTETINGDWLPIPGSFPVPRKSETRTWTNEDDSIAPELYATMSPETFIREIGRLRGTGQRSSTLVELLEHKLGELNADSLQYKPKPGEFFAEYVGPSAAFGRPRLERSGRIGPDGREIED